MHSHGDGGSRTGKRLEVHSTYGLETHALSHGAVSLFGAGWPYGCHQYFTPSASVGDMLHIHKLSIFVSSVAFFANPRALNQRLFGAAVRSPISSCRTRGRKRSIRQSKAFIGQLVPSPIFPQIVNTPSETWFGIGTTYWIILEKFMLASHMFIFGGRVIFVSSQALTSTAKQLDSKMRGNNGPLPDIKVGGRGRALQRLVGKRTKQTETNRVGS